MDLILNNIEAKNSNKKEPMKNNKTNFATSEINLDTLQSMFMREKYQNLTKNTNYELMTNGYQSVNDSLDYVECVNNNCTKITNEMVNKEKDLVKDKKSNNTNVMMKNLDILVSLVYIFLLVVLLLGSVIKRDVNNLINILIITLVYLFYQIYMSYKN